MGVTRTQKGRFNELHLDTDDDQATPSWSEFDLVTDGSYSIAPTMEPTTVRKHGRANRQESTGYDVEISFSFKAPQDPTTNALYVKMRNAAVSGAAVHLKMTDANAGAGEQFIGWYEITGWEKGEPLDGHSTWDVSAVPTSGTDANDADYGAPAFSANPA